MSLLRLGETFCGSESPPVRARLIFGSPRPYSLARKIKNSKGGVYLWPFGRKMLLQQLIKKITSLRAIPHVISHDYKEPKHTESAGQSVVHPSTKVTPRVC